MSPAGPLFSCTTIDPEAFARRAVGNVRKWDLM
jgi:hypothetical protein